MSPSHQSSRESRHDHRRQVDDTGCSSDVPAYSAVTQALQPVAPGRIVGRGSWPKIMADSAWTLEKDSQVISLANISQAIVGLL